MARSPEEKKARIEFVAASEEQKQKFMQEAKRLGYTTSEFFRQAGEAMLAGQTVSSSVDERIDKLLAEKEVEIEQLRAALGIKTNAYAQMDSEIRTLRARLAGGFDEPEMGELAIRIELLIQRSGTISRKEILDSIEDAHKIKGLVKLIEEVELRLLKTGKILLSKDGVIQWLK